MCYGFNSNSSQSAEQKICTGVTYHGLGTHHKHRQALACLLQDVTAADQQNFLLVALEHHKTGLHAAFGVAESSQMRL